MNVIQSVKEDVIFIYCNGQVTNRQFNKNIPRSERVCVKCTQSEIGDEFHYIFNCPFFADQRRTYLPKYCHIHPSAPKFKRIMNDKTKLGSLANFIKIILESVK